MTSYPNVNVFQHGTSQRHTARCECGWEVSVGSLKAAQNLAGEHRQAGCGPTPPSTQIVPAAPATVEPATPWSGEQLELLRQQICPGASDDELAFFAQVCAHKQLDPFLGEIVGIMRYDSRARKEVMKIQETVEGLRSIAERSGLYGGFRGPQWTGDGHTWTDVWLDEEHPPKAARYWVIRKDWTEPAPGVARWASNVQLYKDKSGQLQVTPIWKERPDEMLAKCAEVRALKRTFNKEFARAGVSTSDLSDAQVVTIEARRAGLDDNERHHLVNEVTGGRTESTRDLTEDEVLEVRAEVARRADPATGVIDDPPPDDAVARTIARAAGNLEARMELLTADQAAQIKTFRRAHGLTRPLATLSPADRNRISVELDRRGWGSPYDLEPEPETEPADDVVSGDVVDQDLFNDDEPF